jgi:hypothetical protein
MQSFENLVGMSGEQAKEAILKEHPDFQVQVLPEGSPVTRDFRMNRVRVFVNNDGVVQQAPRTG